MARAPFQVLTECCRSLLKSTQVATKARILHPKRSIVVVKRRYPPRLHSQASYNPDLEPEQYIYDVEMEHTHKPKFTTIRVLMMENVDGVGIMGEVKEVDTKLFRDYLYPGGMATYPTFDKFEELDDRILPIKKDLEALYKYAVGTRVLIKKLIGCHLPVPINTTTDWELDVTHIRVAFRQIGVHVEEDCIILPEEPIKDSGEFKFDIILNNEINISMKGTVYSIPQTEDELMPELPPLWNNPPIETEETRSIIQILFPEYAKKSTDEEEF